MALALYRKYRPRTFAEVIGQEHVTEPLSQALRTGRLHHAYLFSGPRGCGKTSSARILARSLNCEKGPTPDPCGDCDSCRSLSSDGAGSIDVIEIDAASHGGVDDARDLRERAFFAPVSSRFKIYVIDEAHMVSSAGFNALLKLVEEPPDFVKFVFATTEPEKVLGTIKSRTHHYPFRLIPPGVLRPFLEELCTREDVAVEPAVFPLVVRAGGGSARDSLSVLDQLIAGAGAEGVTYAGAAALLGVTDVALIDEMCDALAAVDGAAAFATIDRVSEAGHDPRRFAADLLERLRDLIVLNQVPDALDKGLLDWPSDQMERMSLQAQRFGPATLSRCADIVHNGLVEMRGTTAPRLLLELVTARMLLPAADDTDGGLLHRLERMERRLGASSPEGFAEATPAAVRETPAPPAREVTSAREATPAREVPAREAPPTREASPVREAPATARPAAPPASGEAAVPVPQPSPVAVPDPPSVVPDPPSSGTSGVIDAAAIRRVWDEVLTTVGRRNKRVAAVVREATVRDVDGDTIVLVFRHAFHANALSATPEHLTEALYEVLGGHWQIRCDLAGDQRGPAEPAPTVRTPAEHGAGDRVPADRSGAGRASTPASRSPQPSRSAAPADDEGDWPTPARPGGVPVEAPSPQPDAPPRIAVDEPPAAADHPVYEGFDPGDEPLDDIVDEQTARRTSEQQALKLLQDTLGAEKIGEIEHR